MGVLFPNRCDEVRRTLSAPEAEGLAADAAAEHVAACPECAGWAGRDAALTRLWEATRPAEPPAAAWDKVWARLVARPAPAVEPETVSKPDVVPIPAGFRRRLGVRLFVAAQAASIVAALALGLTYHPPAAAAPRVVEISPNEVVLLRDDGRGVHPVEVASLDDRSNVDGYFTMLNDVEAMAE
jgi:hypothetical protein